MVQSGGIRAKFKRVQVLTCLGLALTLSSGCSAQLDALRPELNSENRLKVDPNTVVVDFDDYKQNTDYFGSGGPSAADRWDPNYIDLNDPAIADRIPFWMRPAIYSGVREDQTPSSVSFVSATDYSIYLEEKVYTPIAEILSALPVEAQSKLYFRVLHTGYNAQSDKLEQAAAYTNSKIGGLTSVSGGVISEFTYEWLTQFSLNDSSVTSLQANALQKANNFIANNPPPEPFSDWSEVDWLAASSTDFPTDLLSMWGNSEMNLRTYADYIRALEQNPLRTVPNLSLYYYTNSNATSKGAIVLNKIPATSVVSRYVSSVDSDTLQKIFTTVNQSIERDAVPTQMTYRDTGSVLFSYYDGYNKTLIFLATAPGENLSEVLGDVANDVITRIMNAYSVTDWQGVTSLYPDATVALEGLRGS